MCFGEILNASPDALSIQLRKEVKTDVFTLLQRYCKFFNNLKDSRSRTLKNMASPQHGDIVVD